MALPGGEVLVVGLGASGVSAARYLARLDDGEPRRVTAVDSSDSEAIQQAAAELEALGVKVLLGVDEVEGGYSLGVISPGVPPSASVFRSAQARCGELISEIELAYRVSRVPWVAVTGTNGKTTTTSLIAHLLHVGGLIADTAGNIGTPAIDVAVQAMPPALIVAEVSSFQLATTSRFHPRVAVLLNITPDHIDWHGTMEKYVADKGAIFANQGRDDTAIIDVDDPLAREFVAQVESHETRVIRVAAATPQPGAATVAGGMLMMPVSGGTAPLISREELGIRGDHNVSNALAAAAAAHACGVGIEAIREGLKTFRPIAHRLEPVSIEGDVEYVNDSKATNPDATIKALTAFPDRPVIVLLGGKNKENEFDSMARMVAERCKLAIAFGDAREEIAASLSKAGAEHLICSTMDQAISWAADAARPGDVVLLSPACASFDEFANYIARGEAFRAAVLSLKGVTGVG